MDPHNKHPVSKRGIHIVTPEHAASQAALKAAAKGGWLRTRRHLGASNGTSNGTSNSTAASPAPIRFLIDTSDPSVAALKASNAAAYSFVVNQLIPGATSWLSSAIFLTVPTAGSLFVPRACASYVTYSNGTFAWCTSLYTDICGPNNTPINAAYLSPATVCNKKGTVCSTVGGGQGAPSADIAVIVSALTSTADCGSTGLAFAGVCRQDVDTDRPVLAYINFCPGTYNDTSTAGYGYVVPVAAHELTHALAFSPGVWPFFRNSSGLPRVDRTPLGSPIYKLDSTLNDYYYPGVTGVSVCIVCVCVCVCV